MLDIEPTPTGNVVLVDGVAHKLTGQLFEPHYDGPRFREHLLSCPNGPNAPQPKKARKR